MSKPWFQIQSVTYSNSVLSVNYKFGRLRGDVFGNKTITIAGFSGSSTYTETDFYDADGKGFTISVPVLGTSSTATYVDPTTLTWNFSGTSSATTNVKVNFKGVQLASVTASGLTLSTFLTDATTALTGNVYGVVATPTSTAIAFTVPNTGNFYNGSTVSLVLTRGNGTIVGTSTLGVTTSGKGATFTAGTTAYNLEFSIPAGGYVGTITTNASLTASNLY